MYHQRAVAARRSPLAGPDVADAIEVASVADEYAFLALQRPDCGGSYQQATQALVGIRGVSYDRLDMRSTKCGTGKTFLYDISSFFRKRG